MTALDIITRGLRLIGQCPAGEPVSPEDAADGLVSLNDMIESMANEEQFVYQIQTETFSWASGQASRTIGAGGNFDTVRPIRITEGTFLREGTTDYDLSILTDDEFAAISDKSASGNLPRCIYGDRAYPLMNLYLYTVPTATVELHLASWKVFGAFAGLTTPVSLPPGYNRMLRFNFAVEVAPEYGVEPSPTLKALAAKSRAVLNPTNNKMERMQLPSSLPGLSRYRPNILTGE